MIIEKEYWNEVRAWKVPPEKLPEFLDMLRGFSSPISFQGVPDGNPWATDIHTYFWKDSSIVTARTISYPYCENKLKEFLDG